MIDLGVLGMRWLQLVTMWDTDGDRRGRDLEHVLGLVCPHCTNVDTLTRHCRNASCLWVRCTCGALAYDRRRHRHPRHRSGRDTCHDPAAAL